MPIAQPKAETLGPSLGALGIGGGLVFGRFCKSSSMSATAHTRLAHRGACAVPPTMAVRPELRAPPELVRHTLTCPLLR